MHKQEENKQVSALDYSLLLEQLIKEDDAASFVGVTRRALQQWRFNGSGPPYVRISKRCIRYRRKDLIHWSESFLRKNTSEEINQ